MDDDSLDRMDPYQRGAHEIIWETIMKGSYKKITSNKQEKHDYYADALEPIPDGNQLGSTSNKIEEYSDISASNYMTGPMVVRVLPDGRPVPGDKPFIFKDEDAEENNAMRRNQPSSIQSIISHRNTYESTGYEVDPMMAQ